jgi:hypothetical protein
MGNGGLRMRKSPEEIIFSLSNQLKGLDVGKTVTMRQLKDETGHHYVTLKNYVKMIKYIQTLMPMISLSTDQKGEFVVKIDNKPILPFDQKQQLLLYLLDNNGYREINAIEIPSNLAGIVESMSENVSISAGKAFLTKEGLLAAMEIAEQREDYLINPIGQQFIESQNPDNYGEMDFTSIEKIEWPGMEEGYQRMKTSMFVESEKLPYEVKRLLGAA